MYCSRCSISVTNLFVLLQVGPARDGVRTTPGNKVHTLHNFLRFILARFLFMPWDTSSLPLSVTPTHVYNLPHSVLTSSLPSLPPTLSASLHMYMYIYTYSGINGSLPTLNLLVSSLPSSPQSQSPYSRSGDRDYSRDFSRTNVSPYVCTHYSTHVLSILSRVLKHVQLLSLCTCIP